MDVLTLNPASQTVCSGSTASLTASGHNGATVTWSANMLSPLGTVTSYVSGNITVLPEPKIAVVPLSMVVCSYETPQFSLWLSYRVQPPSGS